MTSAPRAEHRWLLSAIALLVGAAILFFSWSSQQGVVSESELTSDCPVDSPPIPDSSGGLIKHSSAGDLPLVRVALYGEVSREGAGTAPPSALEVHLQVLVHADEGGAVANANVLAFRFSDLGIPCAAGVTDDEGLSVLTLAVMPGDLVEETGIYLLAEAEGYLPSERRVPGSLLYAASVLPVIDVILEEGESVNGRVLDEQGFPAPEISVLMTWRADRSNEVRSSTGATLAGGRYWFAHPGDATAQVSAGDSRLGSGYLANLRLSAGSSSSANDIHLTLDGRISGSLFLADASAPGGLVITATPMRTTRPPHPSVLNTVSGPDGSFLFAGLPEGEYALGVLSGCSVEPEIATVGAPPAEYTIEGHLVVVEVEGVGGAPVVDAAVHFELHSDSILNSGLRSSLSSLDSSGVARYLCCAPGMLRVHIEKGSKVTERWVDVKQMDSGRTRLKIDF